MLKRGAHTDPTREALILQSVTEAWTLRELSSKLGVSREWARQLLKARGLDNVRVKWGGRNSHKDPREKPIKWCLECNTVILEKGKQKYHAACYAVKLRRSNATQRRDRYRTDQDHRERVAKYKHDHPRVSQAATRRYRQTVGGQLHYQAALAKQKQEYADEPKMEVACLDCGATVLRKQTTVNNAIRHGSHSPLCNTCRTVAQGATRRLASA